MGGNISSWVLNLFFIPNHLVGGSTWIVCPRKQKPPLLVDRAKDLGKRLHLGSSGRKDLSENDLLGLIQGHMSRERRSETEKGKETNAKYVLGDELPPWAPGEEQPLLACLGPGQKMHFRVTYGDTKSCVLFSTSVITGWCSGINLPVLPASQLAETMWDLVTTERAFRQRQRDQ